MRQCDFRQGEQLISVVRKGTNPAPARWFSV